jgi:hypothetical protein
MAGRMRKLPREPELNPQRSDWPSVPLVKTHQVKEGLVY